MKKSASLAFIFIFVIPFILIGQSSEAAIDSNLHRIFQHYSDAAKKNRDFTYPKILPEAQQARVNFLKNLKDSLALIDQEQLSDQNQINYAIFEFMIGNEIDQIEMEAYLIPFNAEGGFYNRLSYAVRNTMLRKEEDVDKYQKRLKAFPQYLRDNIALMRIGMEKGIIAPKLIAEKYRVLIEPFAEPNLDGHLLMQPLEKSEEYFTSREMSKIRRELKKLIQDSILTAYANLQDFMEKEYIPNAREEIGISEIPGGKEYYEQRIAYFTTLPMTPDEVFEKGKLEVARIKSEMYQIIKDDLDFEGSFADFLEFLRTDPQFYVDQPKDLLKEASYLAKKIDGMLPRYFNHLPRLPYGVEPVPAAIAPNYTGGRYSGGSMENHRAGNYWVNTYKLESRPLYVLPSLTLHEAVPGHHLQISLSQELEDLPPFRNRLYLSAFGEGWALYTEWLGKEMGMYETPYEDFGRLTYEMWRACRLVVDVGMHYKGWTREEALKFLSENTALSLHECNTEIDRYIGWPGQAVSYKIGELKIRELRAKAEKELGDDFDIRRFHDKILENGSIPLFILTEKVDEFISQEKEQAQKRS